MSDREDHSEERMEEKAGPLEYVVAQPATKPVTQNVTVDEAPEYDAKSDDFPVELIIARPTRRVISIPDPALIVLVGVTGSGKTTFARSHFKATEVLSPEHSRALVFDDENRGDDVGAAIEVLHVIAAKRLQGQRLTVIDATNVQPQARQPFVELAEENHVVPIAIVLDIPERVCQARISKHGRSGASPRVVRAQRRDMRRSLSRLTDEGFKAVFTLHTEEEVDSVVIERRGLGCDKRRLKGPFDIIGDVHGCVQELESLLGRLGYTITESDGHDGPCYTLSHPENRMAVFLGDFVDRGPDVPSVLRLIMDATFAGNAICLAGNHETRLRRKLEGGSVRLTHGISQSLEQLELEPPEFQTRAFTFLGRLCDSHFVLDEGNLVVSHAGLLQEMIGRGTDDVQAFGLLGETSGENDRFGRRSRFQWAVDYRAKATMVYGHTPVRFPEWLNNTINIDTGCVFGGRLTALRYPERELVSVPAARVYYDPLPQSTDSVDTIDVDAEPPDDMLQLGDVIGTRTIHTRLAPPITIGEKDAAAALEVMGRFAAPHHWLIYLPPTVSPAEACNRPGLLEHPNEAFFYYLTRQVSSVVCEEKQPGLRAVVVICRDETAARSCFGSKDAGIGVCYGRTGRPFFADAVQNEDLLHRIHETFSRASFWDEFDSSWFCFDCEIMPWSAKSTSWVQAQHAQVGAAARIAFGEALESLAQASSAMPELETLRVRFQQRSDLVSKYVDAYRQTCQAVSTTSHMRLMPRHLLATEKRVFVDRTHAWHLDTMARLCRHDEGLFVPTQYKTIDLESPEQRSKGILWWEELTENGAEGIVVKPLDFITIKKDKLIQPALKCRGREHLRLVYGPEYTMDAHLARLRDRNLGNKRTLAIQEFALGIEALERFVRQEPKRRVHECVFGILALESQPVDPRL